MTIMILLRVMLAGDGFVLRRDYSDEMMVAPEPAPRVQGIRHGR